MIPMSHSLFTSDELIAIRNEHLARLESLYAGEHLSHAFVLCGIGGPTWPEPVTDPVKWVTDSLDQLTEWSQYAWDTKIFRPLCLETWYYGVHFVDAVLGATVIPVEQEGSGGWWTECLKTPVGSLKSLGLDENILWGQARALALAMRDTGATVPFLGPQVLASPLNIAVNLYGEEFLVALALEPEAAQHDLRIITDTIVAMTNWYREHMPESQFQPIGAAFRAQPGGFGQICGCSTQLVSMSSYEEFIAPLDKEVLSCFPKGGMIHLCGSHTQHIPTWRDMPEMRAFQLNDRASDDFEVYFKELRDDQIIYFSPTEDTTIKRAMDISGGRRIVIVANLTDAPECDR